MDGRVRPQQYAVGGSGSDGAGRGGRNQHQFHSGTAQQQAIAAVSARGWGARSQQHQQQQRQPGWGAARHGGVSAAAGSRSSSVSCGISVPSIVQFAAPAFTAPLSVSGIAATSAAAAATTAGSGAGLPNGAGRAPLGGGSRGPVEGADVIQVVEEDSAAAAGVSMGSRRSSTPQDVMHAQQQQRQQQLLLQQQQQQQHQQQQRQQLPQQRQEGALQQKILEQNQYQQIHLQQLQQQQQRQRQPDQPNPARRYVSGRAYASVLHRAEEPSGVALLRLLANGQPHWYVGQEALPTGERKTMLFIPASGRQGRVGVTCETMSLQLLTAQSRLVEALAGMYMKSTMFRADEGLGELSLPGAPQAFLPVERALYAAGMRDGDVVTLVDGLPATQDTLGALGDKAHSKCRKLFTAWSPPPPFPSPQNEPCVASVRLTFLRPCGTSVPPRSPQSVLDLWREHVRVIVLNSVPEVWCNGWITIPLGRNTAYISFPK
ncbi:unnamed protein product [Ectocarpus sp. CCAP 1310/34]|nr:unnamed protein product [Ectocarpus sp. CCAP 1310/34]